MIKKIKFNNFRNLSGVYHTERKFNVIVGKNNAGKTNFVDGLKLALFMITGDYCKITQSDFHNSDDNIPFLIEIEFEYNDIPSLNCECKGSKQCGAIIRVFKSKTGKYVKELKLLNGGPVDYDILREDTQIPNISTIPLVRTEEIYTNDFITGINNFIDKEDQYKRIREESKKAIMNEIGAKEALFKDLCSKFGQDLKIDITDPKFSDGKLFVVDGDKPHNAKIGSGYRSVANIILNTLDSSKENIVIIDEIENHLHPSLVRTLIRELKIRDHVQFISTTHSPVVVNEVDFDDIIDISGVPFNSIGPTSLSKLKSFLHPGRAELIFGDNIVLVEGYTEQLLLNYYTKQNNYNWTIINVAGVMFEPYIELAHTLGKKIVVVSDNDISLSDDGKASSARFNNLNNLCTKYKIKLVEVENTLETDLFNSGYLGDCLDLLINHNIHNFIKIAKVHKKIEIAMKLVETGKNLSEWHVIKEIRNEIESN